MSRPRSVGGGWMGGWRAGWVAGLALASVALTAPPQSTAAQIIQVSQAQAQADREILDRFRPANPFWAHVFQIPDGSIAYGSARDGRLLVVFPTQGDWSSAAQWADPSLRGTLAGHILDRTLTARRDQVALLLERAIGEPVVHNATRGTFVRPNARRYGSFLEEWGRIYERFGVPAELGLAQAMVESGWNPTVRSEARAMGFCQWLEGNWNRMKRLSPHEIEGHNQTTQAAYCAAYLVILATKYGSFIPALSEHHAGGTNVGRTVINGERLGGQDIREQYFLGAQFALDLRGISSTRFRDVVFGYGPRSYLYAEMIFGNEQNVAQIRSETRQQAIHAMRTMRAVSLDEVVRRSGLSVDEVRRFNPALVRQVPARATLYLPMQIEDLGRDVAFWRRPPPADYLDVLRDFLRLGIPSEAWHEPGFRLVLDDYRRRFMATGSEEGTVFSTVLAYVQGELFTGRRAEILAEYRTDPRVLTLVDEGLREIERVREASAVIR
jgi:soluble lytic murein transglycosylase-like protein